MDQRKIVFHLARRRLIAIIILVDLGYTFSSDPIGYSTINHYTLEDQSLNSNSLIRFTGPVPEIGDCDLIILLSLDQQPCASILLLEPFIHLSRTTMYRRLNQLLVLQVRRL
jgi:hypothetical protein